MREYSVSSQRLYLKDTGASRLREAESANFHGRYVRKPDVVGDGANKHGDCIGVAAAGKIASNPA